MKHTGCAPTGGFFRPELLADGTMLPASLLRLATQGEPTNADAQASKNGAYAQAQSFTPYCGRTRHLVTETIPSVHPTAPSVGDLRARRGAPCEVTRPTTEFNLATSCEGQSAQLNTRAKEHPGARPKGPDQIGKHLVQRGSAPPSAGAAVVLRRPDISDRGIAVENRSHKTADGGADFMALVALANLIVWVATAWLAVGR